jgi:ribonuclease P protein subunit RPR2
LNYRPRGYEPRGLAWLPYPASYPLYLLNSYKLFPTSPNRVTFVKDDSRRIADERIRILFNKAEEIHASEPERAQRLIDLARRIASRNRVHLPSDLRRQVCRGCKRLLLPNTSRTRIRKAREPHISTTCLTCGHVNRMPLRRRKP